PLDALQTHWPATNFHFGFSLPKSSFMVILSGDPAAGAAASVRVPMGDAAIVSSKMVMIGTFIGVPFRSVELFGDGFPGGAIQQKDLGHRAPVAHCGRSAHCAVAGVGLHGARRRLFQSPLGRGEGTLLIPRGGEVAAVRDVVDLSDGAGTVVHN